MWTGLKDMWVQCGSLKLEHRKGRGQSHMAQGCTEVKCLGKQAWATVEKESPSPHKRTQRMEDRSGDHACDIREWKTEMGTTHLT